MALTERSTPQEEKRRLILEASVRVFARKGYHTSRVGDIAEEAGIAHGLLYHYFGSKEEVLETIFRENWSELIAAFRRVEASDEPPLEQLGAIAKTLLRAWRDQPDLVDLPLQVRAPRDLAHHHPDEVGAIAPRAQQRLRDRAELLQGRLGRCLDPRERLEQLAPVLSEDRLEHLLLGGEVVVEETVRDPRLFGDVADARGVVALRREDADGRVEDDAALLSPAGRSWS